MRLSLLVAAAAARSSAAASLEQSAVLLRRTAPRRACPVPPRITVVGRGERRPVLGMRGEVRLELLLRHVLRVEARARRVGRGAEERLEVLEPVPRAEHDPVVLLGRLRVGAGQRRDPGARTPGCQPTPGAGRSRPRPRRRSTRWSSALASAADRLAVSASRLSWTNCARRALMSGAILNGCASPQCACRQARQTPDRKTTARALELIVHLRYLKA